MACHNSGETEEGIKSIASMHFFSGQFKTEHWSLLSVRWWECFGGQGNPGSYLRDSGNGNHSPRYGSYPNRRCRRTADWHSCAHDRTRSENGTGTINYVFKIITNFLLMPNSVSKRLWSWQKISKLSPKRFQRYNLCVSFEHLRKVKITFSNAMKFQTKLFSSTVNTPIKPFQFRTATDAGVVS